MIRASGAEHRAFRAEMSMSYSQVMVSFLCTSQMFYSVAIGTHIQNDDYDEEEDKQSQPPNQKMRQAVRI